MKFCYIDESGTGDELFAVMAGVIADTYRMNVTKTDWAELLRKLSEIVERPLTEIHTCDLYSGKKPWDTLKDKDRIRIINVIFNWFKQRNHKIVFSAVDKTKFEVEFGKEIYSKQIKSVWRFMALHICLAIQKYAKSHDKNKGHTVLIFDNKKSDAQAFIEIVRNPPDWTDSYYSYKAGKDRFDQIVDVPYFGDSQHVGLIQLADFVSFFLRKNIEIEIGLPTDYTENLSLIKEWANIALNQSLPSSATYPKTARCQCADLFYRYAPSCLLK
ncbi:DUF3800 domain-containing protein [Chloroflexota bacterium]